MYEQDDLDAAMPTGKELFYVVGGIQLMTQILTNTFGNYEARYLKAMDSDGKAFVKRFVLRYCYKLTKTFNHFRFSMF